MRDDPKTIRQRAESDNHDGKRPSGGSSSGEKSTAVILSFCLLFVATTGAFVATEQGHLAYQNRSSIRATVTDANVGSTAREPAVQLQLTVVNPTGVAITVEGAAGLDGRIGDRIVARAYATDFPRVRVPAHDERPITLPLRLYHDVSVGTVERALETGTFVLGGQLQASMRAQSVLITVEGPKR